MATRIDFCSRLRISSSSRFNVSPNVAENGKNRGISLTAKGEVGFGSSFPLDFFFPADKVPCCSTSEVHILLWDAKSNFVAENCTVLCCCYTSHNQSQWFSEISFMREEIILAWPLSLDSKLSQEKMFSMADLLMLFLGVWRAMCTHG